jgi:hypothetical protein
MGGTVNMKIISLILSNVLFFFGAGAALATPPPPKSIELTPSDIHRLQFGYESWEEGANSHIEIAYPEKIDGTHYPHSILISNFDLNGRLVAEYRFPPSATSRSFSSSFIKKKADISVGMMYCKIGAEACIEFIIPSVNKIIAFDVRKKPISR